MSLFDRRLLYEFDRGCTEHAWLHLLMAKNLLLTGRVKAVQSAERLRRDLARGMVFANPAQLLSQVIANYPDTLDGLHHGLLDELEIIEDQVLDERHRGERKRLMLARREMAQLHRHMRSLPVERKPEISAVAQKRDRRIWNTFPSYLLSHHV